MVAFRVVSCIVEIGPDEHHATVSAIPAGTRSAEVRSDVLPTRGEAEGRHDYLVMSLATELRARGHEVTGIAE